MILSAFADEISSDLDVQMAHLRRLSIHWVDLRSVDAVSVLQLGSAQIRRLRGAFRDNGIRVAAIASPVGKVPIDVPVGSELERLERAIAIAHAFDTRLVRLFSFFTGVGKPAWHAVDGKRKAAAPDVRQRVIERLAKFTALARSEDIVLVLENEKKTFCQSVENCLDVLRGVDDPHLRMTFDAANFIECGRPAGVAGLMQLWPWLQQVHVKDITADGRLVPAGDGIADWPHLLAAMAHCGFEGVLTLEPHLLEAHEHGGFSGEEAFDGAARRLAALLLAASNEIYAPGRVPDSVLTKGACDGNET